MTAKARSYPIRSVSGFEIGLLVPCPVRSSQDIHRPGSEVVVIRLVAVDPCRTAILVPRTDDERVVAEADTVAKIIAGTSGDEFSDTVSAFWIRGLHIGLEDTIGEGPRGRSIGRRGRRRRMGIAAATAGDEDKDNGDNTSTSTRGLRASP
jgi:hypothetical protein